jgi:hypothetical protein
MMIAASQAGPDECHDAKLATKRTIISDQCLSYYGIMPGPTPGPGRLRPRPLRPLRATAAAVRQLSQSHRDGHDSVNTVTPEFIPSIGKFKS